MLHAKLSSLADIAQRVALRCCTYIYMDGESVQYTYRTAHQNQERRARSASGQRIANPLFIASFYAHGYAHFRQSPPYRTVQPAAYTVQVIALYGGYGYGDPTSHFPDDSGVSQSKEKEKTKESFQK